MKIIIITQGISKILEPILNSNHEVIGIIESAPRKEPPKIKYLIKKAVVKIYSIFHSKNILLNDFAKNNNIPYYYFKKGDNKNIEHWVKNINPDLIVVYSMSQLLKENIIKIPKYGAINLHPSYLPEYRGPNPVFWMYYNYKLNPGITVHYIDKGEDTGDIICQERCSISTGEKLSIYHNKIDHIGVRLLLQAIDDISSGTVHRIEQGIKSPTQKAKNIKQDEYRKLINWDEWGGERIFHFLNGTPKYNKELLSENKLYKSGIELEILNFKKCYISKYKIGKIYKKNRKHFLVCRDGKIYLNVKFNLFKLCKRLLF